MKNLAEIIKYAEQYKDNRSYHIAYKKAKNPDAYFRRYESQIILYGGARRMLEQAGIKLKGLNVDKLRAEYQALETRKKELTTTYKSCEKEVWNLNIITINEQISNFAQTYPTNLKASSNEALLFMRRYRFANCSCFSCCFKDAYPSSNVQ